MTESFKYDTGNVVGHQRHAFHATTTLIAKTTSRRPNTDVPAAVAAGTSMEDREISSDAGGDGVTEFE